VAAVAADADAAGPRLPNPEIPRVRIEATSREEVARRMMCMVLGKVSGLSRFS